MNKQEIRQALVGKVITFHTIPPFAIEWVDFYESFIMVGDRLSAVPIDNEYVPTLIKYGAVEISHRTYTDETKLVNVSIQ